MGIFGDEVKYFAVPWDFCGVKAVIDTGGSMNAAAHVVTTSRRHRAFEVKQLLEVRQSPNQPYYLMDLIIL